MQLAFNLPINNLSFGQVSSGLLRDLFNKKKDVLVSPIGNNVDLSSQSEDKSFNEWVTSSALTFNSKHDRNNKIFKLWHINGSMESLSKEQILYTFYELDCPTREELNIVKNNHTVFFSSQYATDLFTSLGCKNARYLPCYFDKNNFSRIDKKYYSDDRIVFNIVGKLEKRKHHAKMIKAWIKKYGNDKRYFLQCSIFNPFMKPEDQNRMVSNIINNILPFNVQFLPFMQSNSMYNDYINSADIILGMSGGEGWGLPEFHSIALGKHGVILDAHSYKSWANEKNAILVKPSSKTEAYDGIFFRKGTPYNQGNIFDFNEDDFINGCELAIKRVNKDKTNNDGLLLQEEFSLERFTNSVLNSF